MNNNTLIETIQKLNIDLNSLTEKNEELKQHLIDSEKKCKELEETLNTFYQEETKRIHELLENRRLIEKIKKKEVKNEKLDMQNCKLYKENQELENKSARTIFQREETKRVIIENTLLKETLEAKNQEIIDLKLRLDDYDRKFNDEFLEN